MAKKTLMSDIANDVKEIKDKTKFGTKLPGNTNKEREITLKELSYEQMIMGSIASLTWGVKNIDKDTQIKSLLGKTNIFELIKGINSKLDSEISIFKKIKDYSETNKKALQNINDNLSKVIINSTDAIIKAIGGSLKGSTSKILIDLKAADTIEQLLKEFDALDNIIFFDNDNVNNVKDLLDRIDKLSKENIYLVIDTNLYDTVNELKELKIDLYDPTCLDSIKAEIDSLNNQKIEIFDTDNIDKARKLFEELKKIRFEEGAENALTGLRSFLSAIEESKGLENISKDSDTLKKLTEFFVGGGKEKGSISELINAIGNIQVTLNNEKFDTLSKAFSIVEIASKLMEGHDTKINKRFFRDLNSVLTEESYIKGLINHLNELSIDVNKNVRTNIQTVDDFITAVSNLGNIGFIKLFKSKIAIMAINDFLVSDIKTLIDNILEYKTIKKDTDKTFEALDNLFESITKLGDVSLSDKRKMARNIIFIDKFLSEDIKNIIEKSIPELKGGQKDGFEVLEKTKEIIDSLISIADIDEHKLGIAQDKIEDIKDFITNDINSLFDYILDNLGPNKKLKQTIEVTKLTNEIFENIVDLNDALPGVMSLIKSNAKIMLLASEFTLIDITLKSIGKLSKILTNKDKKFLFTKFDGVLNSIIEINKTLGSLETKKGINGIIALNKELIYIDKLLDNFDKVIKLIEKFDKLNKIAVLSKVSNIGLQGITKESEYIKLIIGKLSDIDGKEIKKAESSLNLFKKLVITSAAILLAGALVMKLINVQDLLIFTGTLSAFLFAVTGVFNLVAKALQPAMDGVKGAVLLIAASGMIMLAGSLMMHYVDLSSLFLFITSLSVFLFSITGIFKLFSKGFEEALYGAQDAVIIVAASALVLLVASKLVKPTDFIAALLFAVELGVFLVAIGLAFKLWSSLDSKEIMNAIEDLSLIIGISGLLLLTAGLLANYIKFGWLALFILELTVLIGGVLALYAVISKIPVDKYLQLGWELSLLVASSGLILILAGLLVQYIDLGSLFLFTLILGAFIGGILLVYSIASKGFKSAFKSAKEMAILIAASALILILGSIAVEKWIDIPSLLLFTVLLTGFIFAITYAYSVFGKRIEKSIYPALALALLTAISGLVLIMGGKYILDHPGLIGAIIAFGSTLIIYTALMGGVCFLLGKFMTNIMLGIVAMGLLLVVTSYAVSVIDKLSKVAAQEGFLKNMLKGVVAIAGVITAIGGIAFAAGALVMGPQALLFAAGVATMTTIVTVALLAAQAVKNIADAMIRMNEVEKFDPSVMIDNIKGFIAIAKEMAPIADSFLTIMKTSIAITTMSAALSSVAQTLNDWSELKIPIYKGTNIVGYETITSDTFDKASENIKSVVSTLAKAIVDVYNENPEMFDGPLFGLLNTPFVKVSKSLKTMGSMLSSIASGVKEWADFKIPVYKGTKIVGYDTITASTMTTAAKNIKSVIKTLGEAIIDTYDECEKNERTKGMFDPQGFLGFGNSKFALVTKAFKTMGPMLSSIANGVSKWADLKIPVYSGTKIVEYKTLKDVEFEKAANNIKKVLKCIGEALVDVVEKNPKIFGDDIMTDGPAIVAAKSMKLMGETLNLTATAVASYASGSFPVFDKDGKYIKDIKVKESDYTQAASNIQKVLVCIGNALKDVVENNDIFNDGLFSDAPAIKAAEAIKGMSEALNNSVAAISKLAELDMNELHTALDPNGPNDNIYHRLNDLLTFTIEIYRLFVSEDSSMSTTGKVSHWWRSDTVEKMSFAEYLNEHNGDVEDANDALGTFTGMLSKILSKYINIGKIINGNKDALKIFEGGYNSDIYKYLNNSMTSIASMIRLLIAEDKLDLFEDIKDKEDEIIRGVKSTTNICKVMLDGVVNIKKAFDEISGFNILSMLPMIMSFNACVQSLSKIGQQEETALGSVNLSLPTIDAALLSAEITMYSAALDMIIKINERAKEAGEEGYNVLRDGILKIYAATQQIEDNKVFSQHVKKLKDYVEAINSIKLNNLGGLKGLVDSMNELSQRLGNLDNLTDAIGNKLSQVLYELVLQLRKAEATINNAHELQEKRKKLMDESIKKIHNIMDHHMIVEITQQKDDDTSSIPTGSIGGNPIDDGAPQGTDTTPSTSTTPKANPEETTAAKGTGNSRVVSQPDASQLKDVLTFGKFKDYMEKQYLNKIRNSG